MRAGKVLFFVVYCALSACVQTPDGAISRQTDSRQAVSGGFAPGEFLVTKHNSFGTSVGREGIHPSSGDPYRYSLRKPGDPWAGLGGPSIKITDPAYDRDAVYRARWSMDCSTDRMTDQETCRITLSNLVSRKYKGGMTIYVDGSGSVISASVRGHDFPGRRARVRIDQGEVFVTNENGWIYGAEARRLERELKNGSIILTEYVPWPDEWGHDESFEIAGGFNAAQDLFRFIRRTDVASLLTP